MASYSNYNNSLKCCCQPGPKGPPGPIGPTGVTGAGGPTGAVAATGAAGPTGIPGARGYDGNSSLWKFTPNVSLVFGTFKTTPTTTNPNFNAITNFTISLMDYVNNNLTQWFTNISINDLLIVRDYSSPGNYGIYKVSNRIISGTIIDISSVFISGSNSLLSNNQNYLISYTITGSTGPTGSVGPTGAVGPTGPGGGGGGGGGDWDTSFNYYFMQKPWRPAYITNGSFSPPTTMNNGTFDISSGQYDPIDQRIELNWLLPPREAAAFNFAVSPRQLDDGIINLEAGTYSAKGISDASYNYLPYHETLHIDIRTKNGGTISAWNPITTNNLALLGTPKPNLYAQTIGAYFVAGTGTITGDYGPIIVAPTVPQFIYQNENFLQLGSTQYQFRIYLKNKSKQVLPSPDYFGTINPEWNYLYMPDTSGAFFVFGSFGPATPPQLINMAVTDYRRLNVSGANNFPNSSSPYADMSLNTPFPSLSLYGLHVNYGFDLSGSLSSSSLQFQTPPAPYQTFDISYVSNNITINNWSFNSNFNPLTSNDLDNGNNSIIFPGYDYDVSGYFMKLNSDLSYNVYTTNYPTPTTYPTVLVDAPTRNDVTATGVYDNFLSGSFFTNANLSLVSGTSATLISSVYYTGSLTPLSNVYFFSQNSIYNLSNSSLDYSLRNSRTLSEYQSDLGTALVAQNLCYFKFSTDATVPQDLTGTMRIGYTGNDVATSETNSYFEFDQSASLDAITSASITAVQTYRLRGWYLGVDVSNLLIKDVQLSNYPDICNNSFTPWNIDFSQYFANNTLASTPLNYQLSIAKKPLTDITLNGFSETHGNPTLTQDFFGLQRPSSDPVSTFTLDGQFIDMNLWWRPSNTLMSGDLRYASSASSGSGNSIKTYSITWPYNPQPAIYNISSASVSEKEVDLDKTVLTSTYKYSRDRAFIPQFYIDGTHDNNVTYSSPVTPTPSTLDISFNSKLLWWDFTTLNTALPFTYTLHTPGTGEYPTNYSTYSTTYSHSTLIGDQQLMWCKTGFTAGTYTTIASENPYIDYSVNYYGQTVDYSSKNTTGISKSLSYTVSNDDYYEGGNKTISGTYKWILISDTRVSASSFGKIVVSGTGGTTSPLKLGDDFLLYIQEIDTFFSPGISIPSGYASGRSGWKAVQGTWDQGATVQLNNADEAGAYRRNTNSGAVAIHFIKYYSPNTNTQVFYRIGIKNGSNIKISDVELSYGIT